jgi:hypothetical protein
MKELSPCELSNILDALDAAAAARPLRIISRPVREQWKMETEYTPFDAPIVVEPDEPESNRLDQLACLVRTLVYGDLMQMAADMWKAKEPTKGNRPITQADLPMMLHRWATKGMA